MVLNKGNSFRSFKQYSINKYEKAVCKVIFPNYKKRNNVVKAYNNFLEKLIEVVNKIVALKTVKIKITSTEWLEREIIEV